MKRIAEEQKARAAAERRLPKPLKSRHAMGCQSPPSRRKAAKLEAAKVDKASEALRRSASRRSRACSVA